MQPKRVAVVMVLAIITITAMSAAVEARTIVKAPIVIGQETGFVFYPEDTVEICLFPNQAGNLEFTTYHSNLMQGWKVDDPGAGLVVVDFYWKDTAGDNQWHHWRSASVNCYWPKTEQNLYSGSNTICYKFVYSQSTQYPIPIHIMVK